MRRLVSFIMFGLLATGASAQTAWPTRDGVYTIANFRFGTGQILPQLRLHYLTLGTPHTDAQGHTDNAVLLLHGTGGDAHSLMNPVFADVLFGPGQPLDIRKYFIILPDDIGHGSSSKPSDGLHARFPQYDYDDMVASQHTMLLQGLKIDHLRLILGTSIEQDPQWLGGEYKSEPIQGLSTAIEMTLIMGSSPLQMQKRYPTRVSAEAHVDDYLKRHVADTDANDLIYYYQASRNYDPSANLERITVPVLYINSADDYINPPELGIAENLAKRMPHCRFILIPISDATRGHGTHTVAAVWKDYLVQLLAESEPGQPRH
jgi:homoserine O-acetyltransferase/O-succinyltransferase